MCACLFSATLGWLLHLSRFDFGVSYITRVSWRQSILAAWYYQRESLGEAYATITNDSKLEVGTGYLGLCVGQAGGRWDCGNSARELAGHYQPRDDPCNLIAISAKFREGIISPAPMQVHHSCRSTHVYIRCANRVKI